MAYDEGLAQRIRETLGDHDGIAEKSMFGGLSFLLEGNLAVGVIGDELCVRVGPDAHAEMLNEPGAHIFDFSGRPMKGWLMVEPAGVASDEALDAWVQRGLDFAETLPPK